MHTPTPHIIRFRRRSAQSLVLFGLALAVLAVAAPVQSTPPENDGAPLPRMPEIDGMGLAESWEHAVIAAAGNTGGDLAPVGYRVLSHQGESYLLATDEPGIAVAGPEGTWLYWAHVVARHLEPDEGAAPRPLTEQEAGTAAKAREGGGAAWSLDGAALLKARPVRQAAACARCHGGYGEEGTDLVLLFRFAAYADD